MKLSDKLRSYREDHPGELTMNEFIRLAEELEGSVYTHEYNDFGVNKVCSMSFQNPDIDGFVVIMDAHGSYQIKHVDDVTEK